MRKRRQQNKSSLRQYSNFYNILFHSFFMSNYSFLVVGKTKESTESQGFKRYVGLGSSYVLAVNPSKKELDELRGFESQNDPEYVVDTDNGKEVRINFVVRTDPKTCNDIETTNILSFTLRNAPAYSQDGSTVQVIDAYGNYTRVSTEEAKASHQLPGNYKIDQNHYRMAAVGECDLVDFLKKYLGVPSSMDYINGTWVLNDKADDGKFKLEHFKDYFKGDFSELREALEMQPNNKVKLLYGVRTSEDGRQYQAVCNRGDFILHNNAGSKALAKLEGNLASAKARGSWATTDYRVCPLQEWTVEPTNFEAPSAEAPKDDFSSEMPWEA